MSRYAMGAWAMIGMAAVTFPLLLVITAPYGRHVRTGWGPLVSPRLGWVVMESPAVLGFAAFFSLGPFHSGLVPLTLFFAWLAHYVHRAFVFPFRLPAGRRSMPAVIVAMGFSFNVFNGWLNGGSLAGGGCSVASLRDPRLLAGLVVFAAGMALNVRSDALLLRLRRDRSGSYAIPAGGLYRWVSCPNYLGEIIEWCGWAVATWSLAGLAFAVFTTANLVPRALAHHRWYRKTFADYPRRRRALVPWVL